MALDYFDFIADQEIASILSESIDLVEADYLAPIFQRHNLRLSDEIILKVIQACKKVTPNPSLKQLEICYDALHYFLVRSDTRWANVKASYIQSNWAGCSRDYLGALKYLHSVGLFENKARTFNRIQPSRSLRMEKPRELFLTHEWWDLLLPIKKSGGPAQANRPYGFQPHLIHLLKKMPLEDQKEVLKGLPRSLSEKMKGTEDPEGSNQLMCCGLHTIPHLLNQRLGIRTYPLFRWGTRDRG